MSEPKSEHANYIVSAAARLKIGDDFYIIPSVRHFDELFHKNNEIYKLGLKAKYPMLSTGQIRRRVGGDTLNGGHLFSENLY